MKRSLKRAVSLTAAAVVACSCTVSTAAFTLPEQQEMTAQMQSGSTEPVPVIISLNSDAVMEGEPDTDFLETSEAAAEAATLEQRQDAVIAKIRKLYPELEVRQRYTTLINGFACTIPENLIGQVEELSAVSSVERTGNIQIQVETESPFETPELPAYYDETGCTGEGQVIAVIDTELDVTHPMFAPLAEDIETKLDKSDIEAIQNSIGFHGDFTADQAYYSSKVPFAIDYSGDPESLENENIYHGTHVCGIAAGNRITNSEGKPVQGIAPDAQLVFFGIDFESMSKEECEELIIAALEDAAKLHVDAVNLSAGTVSDPLEDNILTEAINQAEAAGITVCFAAGNSDNGQIGLSHTLYADSPAVSTLTGLINEGTHALAVASANNPVEKDYHTLMHDGHQMIYEGCYDEDKDQYFYLGDELEKREYEYVYCGYGFDINGDYEGKDLTGKIALIDRGMGYFWEKALDAESAGAVGVIVIQSTADDPIVAMSDADIPLAMVSKKDGDILRNAEVKTVSFTDETVHVALPTEVSDYTSWGIHATLELRPDIMGIGGYVESASYDGETRVASGTSMASPYLAGCSAILKQYLIQNGCALTGSELSRYMRNLMMTGAAPLRKDDMFVTPRRQGAGFVDLNRSIHSKILLTGAEGESKINLRNKLGTEFTFPLTLTNISNEDVSFSSASIALTTDDSYYEESTGRYRLLGQQPLKYTADLRDAAQIAAGETKTVDITVKLNTTQVDNLKKIFTSGFFVEGYLLLGGAENSADISVPMVGFLGNYAQIPIFLKDRCCANVLSNYDKSYNYNNTTFCHYMEMHSLAFERMAEDERAWAEWLEYGNLYTVRNFITYEEKEEVFDNSANLLYCSPNSDGAADNLRIYAMVERECYMSGLEILDGLGTVVKNCTPVIRADDRKTRCFPNYVGPNCHLNDLKEGRYTMRLKAALNKNASAEDMPYIDFPLVIDNTAPVITQEKKEADGRQILELSASDNYALDGIVVIGKGTGDLVGSSRPMSNKTGMLERKLFDAVFEGNSSFRPYYEREDIDYNALHPFMQEVVGYDSDACDAYFDRFTYMDFIPADKNGGKTLTVSYDITDLEDYEVIVLDRAFNMTALLAKEPSTVRGDVNCDDTVDVADAVMLARFVVEDNEVFISEQGKKNADCNNDGTQTSDDVVMILRAIARLIRLDE